MQLLTACTVRAKKTKLLLGSKDPYVRLSSKNVLPNCQACHELTKKSEKCPSISPWLTAAQSS